jgi:acyl phosphate:glycerol-3-phosphate acyltransferase
MFLSESALLSAIGGYFLGSLPFGLIFGFLFGLGDIRKIGSGNIGTTNMLRTGNKTATFLTLLFDLSKAAVAALLASLITHNPVYGLIAGTCAVLGHNFPVWLKFKGGKGVASTLGMLLATSFPVGLAACLCWLGVAIISGYSSLSALISLSVAPLVAFLMGLPKEYTICYAFLALLSIARHHGNIVRLIQGKESKIQLRKK